MDNLGNLKGLTAALVSLGCDKNRVDSEVALGMLAAAGCEMTRDLGCADVIIINTCGFLQSAVEEARETVADAVKRKRPGAALIVTGCAAARYKQQFIDMSCEINAVLGVNEYHKLIDVIAQTLGHPLTSERPEAVLPLTSTQRVLSTPRHFAYLKIAEGCDKHCTYCTIPQIRGPFVSRPIESLVEEARILADSGVRELVLVAQDTTLYGTDLYKKQMLHRLLWDLSQIPQIRWLRVLYAYPELVYDELINEMSKNPKVLPYLDMPIQHASDPILKLMGRKSTQKSLKSTIAQLRRAVPGITLRTTLMAGFPGETKYDFTLLCDFIKEMEFDRLGVFAYSLEEGTAAANLPGHLADETKEARRRRLMLIQQGISAKLLAKKAGKQLEVVVEGSADGMLYGRSPGDAPEIDGLVYFTSDEEHQSGDFVTVSITKSTEYDLIGEHK